MDLATFLIQAVFAIVFAWSVRAWLRRRDGLSLDVVLVFLPMTMLSVVGLARVAAGSIPPVVSALSVVLLLAQPVLTLRLASRITAVPRAALAAVTVGWAVTAVPLAIVGSTPPPALVLAAVGVFVIGEAAAAGLFAVAARSRTGASAARLWIAAFATGLFALAILAAGGGTAGGSVREVSTQLARLAALLAALGYLAAFLPPGFLRRTWQASTAYRGLRELLALEDSDPAELWRRYLALARDATRASGALVVARAAEGGGDRIAMVDGLDVELVGRRLATPIATEDEVPLASLGAGGPSEVGEIGAAVGARYTQVLRLGPGSSAPRLVLFTAHRNLFLEDDSTLLRALGQQTAALAEHHEALFAQERLTRELEQTVDALRAASQAKSDFLASMSHELRTPLNAIIGFSDLIRFEIVEGRDSVEIPVEWIDHIRRGGSHLVELVNDVLDLSKVEAGRLDIDREPLELQPAIAESVAGLRPLADRKGLTIELAIPAGEHVLADRGRLRQIVYNLLSNAIKFTPEGGRVVIEGRRVGDEIEIHVVDTGVGIAPEDHATVFEEFRQVGQGEQRSEGTGLGLALTRRLVEAHGGRMRLESTLGVGSRFTTILPRAEAARTPDRGPGEPPLAAATDAADPGAGPDGTVARQRAILVVEDDPSAVRLLRAFLEPEGYVVTVASSGEAALELVRRDPPAAILLDVLLPGIDGWEVLRLLKADGALRTIPVVIITVIDEKEVGLALGARDYLVKPVERDALVASLARLTFTTKVKTRQVRILAIDDDPGALDTIDGILAPAGFDVLRADSGREGMERARAERPDLVICDLVMPDVDGFGVVGTLADDPATADIPIIILTGYDVSSADKERLNGKVHAIVTKGAGVHDALLAWLDRAQVRP